MKKTVTPRREWRYQGIPGVLRPRASRSDGARPSLELVEDGPRDLVRRPFDYRNPFPLMPLEKIRELEVNGSHTTPAHWPIEHDSAEFFDYYLNDNAAIGLPGGPECALVDFHGTLRAYTGAWAFGWGPRAAAPELRQRHLRDGALPIVLASQAMAGATVAFKWFTAALPGLPPADYPFPGNGTYQWVGSPAPRGPNPVHYCSCLIHSAARRPVQLHLGYDQALALCAGAFYANPRYAPAMTNLKWLRHSARWTLLQGEADGARYCLGAFCHPGFTLSPAATGRIRHWPNPLPRAPERHARQEAVLTGAAAPGRERMLWGMIPHFPLPFAAAGILMESSLAGQEEAVVRLWNRRDARRMRLEIPEPKVAQAFRQALHHLDLCAVRVGETAFPTPGPSGGHHVFYDRDAPDMIYAYALAGDFATAERMIAHYWQRSPGQEECGLVLWLIHRHYTLTRNTAWLKEIFPLVTRCVTTLVKLWVDNRGANGGLMPPHTLCDNELAKGHYVSHHLYAVAGAEAAVELAAAAGRRALARDWTPFAAGLGRAVRQQLNDLGRRTGGVITPTFEGHDAPPVSFHSAALGKDWTPQGAYGPTGGCDWHNVAAVFPTGVLPPHHPLVNSSLDRWRHTYVEGIFPYPSDNRYFFLHNYNTMNLTGTWLRRGDWAEAVRDLYGLLLHTSGTHASAEGVLSTARWDSNCTPHNWFSGKLVRLIRDCLAYEGDDARLHLLAGLSPAWMQPGQTVGLRRAPTDLGPLTFRARMRADGMSLRLRFTPCPEARGVVLHLPPFVKAPEVRADGRTVRGRGQVWSLPCQTARVEVRWQPAPWPAISFEQVVGAYLRDYRRRAADATALVPRKT